MPYWNNKKTAALRRAFRTPIRNQMTWSKNVSWHQKKSRSILSRHKPSNATITAREFKALERRVRKNQQEVHSFRVNGGIITQTGAAYTQTNIDIAAGIKGGTNFREHVLGDKMRIKGFNLRISSEVQNMRVILYRSKRTANVLDLTSFTRPLTAFYDKMPLKAVYFDKTYTRNANEHTTQTNPTEQFVMSVNKALNYVSQFNSDNSDLQETPPLRLLIIAQGALNDVTRYGYEVFYQNV